MDVARKLTILAREIGLQLDLADVEVESLVPGTLREGNEEDFLSRLVENDGRMNDLLSAAKSRGEALRYVGIVESNGHASVRLRAYKSDHAMAGLSGSDNIVLFKTARYNVQPMVVRGPGAGPEVTAAGVFADLLRLASFLGAPL